MLFALAAAFSSQCVLGGTIFHAHRKLRMSSNEPLAPKDFYVDLGARDGIRVGDRLAVLRTKVLRDTYNDTQPQSLALTVGNLVVLAVGEAACVGREEPSVSAQQEASRSILDYPGLMVGDHVLNKPIAMDPLLNKTSLPSGPPVP